MRQVIDGSVAFIRLIRQNAHNWGGHTAKTSGCRSFMEPEPADLPPARDGLGQTGVQIRNFLRDKFPRSRAAARVPKKQPMSLAKAR